MKTERKLNDDFALARDNDELWVIELEEGNPLFALDEYMARLFTDCPGYCDELLVYVAILISLARSDAFARGKLAGADIQRKQFQHMLGLDGLERIAEAIEEIAGRS